MAEVSIRAERREERGKGAARRARAAGKVPAVVYGGGIEPLPIAVDRREFTIALHTDSGLNTLINLQLDGDSVLALTKELQRDPVRGTVLHADFIKVDRTQEVEVAVPVHLVGQAPGVEEGGVLEHQLTQLHVRCRATEVPEFVEADVSALGAGDSLRVADLSEGRSFQIVDDPETVVATVAAPVSAEEFEAMEAGVTQAPVEALVEGEAPPEQATSAPDAGSAAPTPAE